MTGGLFSVLQLLKVKSVDEDGDLPTVQSKQLFESLFQPAA